MVWKISFSDVALKEMKKLDRHEQELILSYLHERIDGCADPRAYGDPLKHNLLGSWRYRVGKYRILCELVDDIVMVYIVKIDHRRSVYVRSR